MASTSADATRVSTEAAQRFVESYYPALQSARPTLASFYLPPTHPNAHADVKANANANVNTNLSGGATIVINGNVIPDAHALQTVFEQQMPQARYEVQSYDCHVLNPEYDLGDASQRSQPSTSTRAAAAAAAAATGGAGKNMSIIVTVSGYVRYGEARDAPMRGFSESFVLVPHPDGAGSGRAKGPSPKREWVIQCQNFRLVV